MQTRDKQWPDYPVDVFLGEGGYATDYGFLGLVGSNADLTWHYIRTNSDCSTE